MINNKICHFDFNILDFFGGGGEKGFRNFFVEKKIKRKPRKVFTKVELRMEIGVIAILAAVLIPTFSGIVKKANMSADQQALRQMNTALSVASVDREIKDIDDVYEILEEAGFNAENYVPLSKNTRFAWSTTENKIVLITEENKIIYPNEETDKVYNKETYIDLVQTEQKDPNLLEIEGSPVATMPDYATVPPAHTPTDPEIVQSTKYLFMPDNDGSKEYADAHPEEAEYADWIADFVVILNDDFAANTGGLFGYYELFGRWVMMPLDQDLEAGTSIELMSLMGYDIPYSLLVSVCAGETGFYCGAYNLDESNIGSSITVQLRLYKPNEDGSRSEQYVICNQVTHTFYNVVEK